MSTCLHCQKEVGINEYSRKCIIKSIEGILCESCASDLIDKTPRYNFTPEKSLTQNDFVKAAVFPDELQATQAAEYLESLGIEAIVNGKSGANAIIGGNSTTLLVSPDNIAKAQGLIEGYEKHVSTDNRPYTFLLKDKSWMLNILAYASFLPVVIPLLYKLPLLGKIITLIISLIITLKLISNDIKNNAFVQHYVCFNSECNTLNHSDAKQCSGCGKEIKGVLAHRDDVLAKEDELGL